MEKWHKNVAMEKWHEKLHVGENFENNEKSDARKTMHLEKLYRKVGVLGNFLQKHL